MQNLRRHAVDPAQPFEFHLAADARNSRTDYSDDQAWTVKLGRRDEAAIAFQTQYGGRAGLVSLVPMWRLGDRTIYQHLTYAEEPVMTHFAPNYLQIEAAPLPELKLVLRFWAMESRAAGCEFNLTNNGTVDISLQLDLFGHVVINGRNRKLNVLTIGDYSLALHLGQIGNINPVVTLEGASADIYGGRISSPKIGCRVELAPGASTRIPFVSAGLADMRDSFSVAMNWMSRTWDDYFERINRDAAAVPKITTGNADWDRLIDLSYVHLIQSFMSPTEHLPHCSPVANRAANRGWSRRGDGGDHIRAWSGQDPTLACLSVPAIAGIDAELAKGIILNFLSTQDESGFVDRQPGLGGQRQGLLMMPLLARLSWMIYAATADQAFLADVLPALVAFFGCWLNADHDADDDGLPEWRSERQMGYIAFPTFGRGQAWAQGADIRQMETPDLLAYLISEADAICQIAELLDATETGDVVSKQLTLLEARLEELWDGTRFTYRDRDTNLTSEGIRLLQRGAGDQVHEIDQALLKPARVMVRVVGGVSQVPRVTLEFEGVDAAGQPCLIEAGVDDFDWQNRQGVFTTEQPLSHVQRIAISGLSRVYKVYAETIDSSRLDINALLPLWTGRLKPEQAASLVRLALDEERFLRPNGVTMVSASDRNFDPSNARGGGGIWMYWLSLVGEGLLKSGYRAEATALIKRVLNGLARVLEREGKLSQFYHADEAKGFGEDHHIGGIVPLTLLGDVIGVRVTAPDRVWVGGEFTWSGAITIEQHGVTVRRGADEIRVDFPSGHSETLAADAPWQLIMDPTPQAPVDAPVTAPALPDFQLPSERDADGSVKIEVEDAESHTIGGNREADSAGDTPPPAQDTDEESPGH